MPVITRRSSGPRPSPRRLPVSPAVERSDVGYGDDAVLGARSCAGHPSRRPASLRPPQAPATPGRTRGAAMKVCHFSEMAYHPAWDKLGESFRVIVPGRLYDPQIGAELYLRYLDEWALCDEL